MLVETLAVVNCLALIALALLALKYTRLVEASWLRPWPTYKDREPWGKERQYRWGIERKRMLYSLAPVVCFVTGIVLSGALERFWIHNWLRLASMVFVLVGMWSVLGLTSVHNHRSFMRSLKSEA